MLLNISSRLNFFHFELCTIAPVQTLPVGHGRWVKLESRLGRAHRKKKFKSDLSFVRHVWSTLHSRRTRNKHVTYDLHWQHKRHLPRSSVLIHFGRPQTTNYTRNESFFYNHGQTGGVEDGWEGEGAEQARGTRRVASVGTAIYLPPLCKILEPRSAPWASSLGKRQN